MALAEWNVTSLWTLSSFGSNKGLPKFLCDDEGNIVFT